MTPQAPTPSPPRTVGPRLALHLWCALLTCVVFWPFLQALVSYLLPAGPGPVSLVLRDMVVPHSMALNDLATGRDGLPRAVPQDTVLAWLSPVIPPPVTVSVLMLAGGYAGSLGAASLARRVGGSAAAATLGVTLTLWNPYIAERLLQGHWSVVLAAVLLPAVAVTAMRRTPASPPVLLVLLAVCSLTPTGLILATVTAVVASGTLRRLLTVLGAAVLLALPWAVPTLVHAGAGATLSDAAGAELFAARAETGVGTLGALAGLGGIWNAGAVPASREALAPVSTWAGVVLAVVVVAVAVVLLRRGRLRGAPLFWLAVAAVCVPAVLATTPGVAVTGWFTENLPGAGLVRDTQKFLALALPGMVVVLAQAVGVPRRRRARAGTTVALLVLVWVSVAALPRDLADLAPVELGASYAQAAEAVGNWQDAHGRPARTLLWPPGSYREVAGRPALDPALKMLPGAPVDPGYLIVDGRLVDGDPTSVRLLGELASGEDTLSANGVDLVLVEDPEGADDAGDAGDGGADGVLRHHHELWSSGGWRLYEVTG